MGKRRIEIKKIIDKQTRKVTCSKRRLGLFSKAKEFCNLTDAEIAIITFTPGGKPFVLGKPSVQSVIDRYELSQQASDLNMIPLIRGEGEDDVEASRGRREEEIGTSDDDDEVIQSMGLNELREHASWVEDERNKLIWEVEDRKRRDSCTMDLLGRMERGPA